MVNLAHGGRSRSLVGTRCSVKLVLIAYERANHSPVNHSLQVCAMRAFAQIARRCRPNIQEEVIGAFGEVAKSHLSRIYKAVAQRGVGWPTRDIRS